MQGEFEQYRAMGIRIERLKMQLRKMECLKDTVKGSSAEYPYTQHTMTVSGRNAAEETRIQQEIASLMTRREKVRHVINDVEDERMKLLLELKYLEGVRWKDIPALMEEDTTESAVRMRADRFFEKF